jgi:hypothetical protein
MDTVEPRLTFHLRKVRYTHEGSLVETERWYFPDTHVLMESIVLSSAKIPYYSEEDDNANVG